MTRVPRHRPPVGFVAQSINRSLLDFETQTKKPSQWFWGQNHQIIIIGFETQTEKPTTTLVLTLNQENHHRFWGQSRENRPSGFEAKLLTNRQPWFWDSTKKSMLFIFTCTMQIAHGITWPSDRPVTKCPTCTIISGHLHQVSYSYHNPHRCPPYRTWHLHIMRQANVILQMKQR
jgi:hypothetical protein